MVFDHTSDLYPMLEKELFSEFGDVVLSELDADDFLVEKTDLMDAAIEEYKQFTASDVCPFCDNPIIPGESVVPYKEGNCHLLCKLEFTQEKYTARLTGITLPV